MYYMGAHWRNLANTNEPSVCDGDAALLPAALRAANAAGI